MRTLNITGYKSVFCAVLDVLLRASLTLKRETSLVEVISFEEWWLGLGTETHWPQGVKQGHLFGEYFYSTFYILGSLHNNPLK